MTSETDRRLFKKLTTDNWLTPDETARHIVRVAADGTTHGITKEDWTALILEHELEPSVPEDIRNMFEVAQGVLCYGCFFYPLYTLGSEQLYRVLEAAVMHKCASSGAPNRLKQYADALKWLRDQGIMSTARFEQWSAARQLRNQASHADRQSIYDPTMAVSGVALATELISELYGVER
ncbi:MAG: hypothetical protein RIE22_00985 [Alphaproteobacteria bacterium]